MIHNDARRRPASDNPLPPKDAILSRQCLHVRSSLVHLAASSSRRRTARLLQSSPRRRSRDDQKTSSFELA